jgi:excinuclease UvrABC nuclease subunit
MRKAVRSSPRKLRAHQPAALTRKRKLSEENVARVPAVAGVYVLYGTQGSPAFVGRGRSLRARLADQLITGRIPAAAFAFAPTATMAEATHLEHELIGRLLPRFNVHSAA